MSEHIFKPLPQQIDFGIVQIKFYALFILIGAIIGILLVLKDRKKYGVSADHAYSMITYSIVFGFIGSRIYYVIYEWSNFQDNLLRVFYIWEGGLAIHGGVIAASLFLIYYTWRHKINLFCVFEAAIPSLILAQAIGRWGNFFNQEAHGGLVPGATLDLRREFLSGTLQLPDFITNNMYLIGPNGLDYYHPTFLYESLWNIIGFLIIVFVLRKLKKYWVGEALSFYFVWYSFGRFFIEGMRTDSLYLGEIRIAQLVSILLILLGIGLFIFRRVKKLYPVTYKEQMAKEPSDV